MPLGVRSMSTAACACAALWRLFATALNSARCAAHAGKREADISFKTCGEQSDAELTRTEACDVDMAMLSDCVHCCVQTTAQDVKLCRNRKTPSVGCFPCSVALISGFVHVPVRVCVCVFVFVSPWPPLCCELVHSAIPVTLYRCQRSPRQLSGSSSTPAPRHGLTTVLREKQNFAACVQESRTFFLLVCVSVEVCVFRRVVADDLVCVMPRSSPTVTSAQGIASRVYEEVKLFIGFRHGCDV